MGRNNSSFSASPKPCLTQYWMTGLLFYVQMCKHIPRVMTLYPEQARLLVHFIFLALKVEQQFTAVPRTSIWKSKRIDESGSDTQNHTQQVALLGTFRNTERTEILLLQFTPSRNSNSFWEVRFTHSQIRGSNKHLRRNHPCLWRKEGPGLLVRLGAAWPLA